MSPTYLRVKWIHDFEDEPDLLYYELDEERYAARSIEILKDGRRVRASEEDPERNPMALPDQPAPPVEGTDTREESRTREIAARKLEEAWSAASGDR